MYFFYYIPVGIDSPRRRLPLMTYSYALICLVVFFLNKYFYASLPFDFMNFIYSPQNSGITAAMAAAFLHFGYLHLISNLIYLLIFGRYVEDRFGPILFTLLYLSSSVVGNVLQGQFNVEVLNQPVTGIIGASGAIAGILGAFVVRFYSSRLKIAYWVFLPLQAYTRMGYVYVPAILGVALWMVLQVAQGMLQVGGIALNVAYVTHIAGFLWGMTLALAFGQHRKARLEAVWRRAQHYLAKGETYAAQGELIRYISMYSGNPASYAGLARTMAITGDHQGATRNYREALSRYLILKQRGKAEDIFEEAVAGYPEFTIDSRRQLELAFGLERNLKPDLAVKAYRNFSGRYPKHPEAPFTLLREANLQWHTLDNEPRAAYCYRKLIDRYPQDEWFDYASEQVRILSLRGVSVSPKMYPTGP
jgi:membrane associated rhomboid family serine protease/outer membrane protein assembly factor BamD (BamD/ComL family)